MKTLLILCLCAALWHFVYEGIIAPSIRLSLRNKLFSIRDSIRQVSVDGLSDSDEKAFWFVHDGINNFINRLPYLTINGTASLALECERDQSLRKLLNEHIDAVMSSSDKRISQAFKDTNVVIEHAFLANMGGWFIYVLPIAFVMTVASKLSRFCEKLVVAPTSFIERISPPAYA